MYPEPTIQPSMVLLRNILVTTVETEAMKLVIPIFPDISERTVINSHPTSLFTMPWDENGPMEKDPMRRPRASWAAIQRAENIETSATSLVLFKFDLPMLKVDPIILILL